MKKILLVGWQGHNNIGDEAIYLANQKLFPDFELIINQGDLNSPVSLWGGGTLLPRWCKKTPMNKVNIAFGVGVEPVLLVKGLKTPYGDLVKKFNFQYIGVRGPRSKKELDVVGIESNFIGDPALILQPESYHNKKEGLIGINIGIMWGISKSDQKKVLKEMVGFCHYLKEQGFKPILIPFWSGDIEYIKLLSEKTGVPIFKNWNDVYQVIEIISKCQVIIGEKLHSVVLSAASGVPFISIAYSEKCFDFVDSLNMDDYIIHIKEFSKEKLIGIFQKTYDDRESLSKRIIQEVTIKRNKLIMGAEEVTSIINKSPENIEKKEEIFLRLDEFFTKLVFYIKYAPFWAYGKIKGKAI